MTRLALVSLLAMLLGSARADVLRFPGCAATLQACLDAADTGDTVQVAADVPTAEALVVARGVTLEAAPDVQPRLAFGTTITVLPAGSAPLSVTIRNLGFRGGWIDVVHERAAALSVTITGNRFVHGGPVPIVRVGEPIKVPDDPYGPLTAVVSDNVLVADAADSSNGIQVRAVYSASLSAVVARNVLDVAGVQQGGIEVVSGAPSATLDVIANRISGIDYVLGIAVVHVEGELRARVLGNVVTDQQGDGSDQASAVFARSQAGGGDLLVANNSVVGNRDGIDVARDAASEIATLVANNLVVGNGRHGLWLAPAIANRHNLIFANGEEAFTPGPGTVLADPLFAPGTVQLRETSPARDAGDTAVAPADVTTDAAGNRRIAGPVVDIGAYEVPCPACDPPAPIACDDGDPCTTDALEAGACVHVPLSGTAAVACTCARGVAPACAGREVPAGVRRKADRACTLIAGADGRKTTRRATKLWTGALRQARARATRRRVGDACADALSAGLGDVVARARTLLAAR